MSDESPVSRVLYLHGFRSSPQSNKARLLASWMAEHQPDIDWMCPQLPPSPRDAMDIVAGAVLRGPAAETALIGSSLGGWYATVAAERYGCRAVLLNPAIDPARDLARYIGETTHWHDAQRFDFRAEYVDELRALQPAGALTDGQRYFAVIAKGDEVLDWREMTARYDGCRIKLLEGGDHALSDFPHHVADVVGFLGLA
jgi:predicted esterase YcpF (UPF0227 family)